MSVSCICRGTVTSRLSSSQVTDATPSMAAICFLYASASGMVTSRTMTRMFGMPPVKALFITSMAVVEGESGGR